MKTKRKRSARRRTASVRVSLPPGMSPTREVPKSRVRRRLRPRTPNVFTPMETGRPDEDRSQVGEGERQSDDLAALERIEPDL